MGVDSTGSCIGILTLGRIWFSGCAHTSGPHSIRHPLYGLVYRVSTEKWEERVSILATHHAGARKASGRNRVGANVAVHADKVDADDYQVVYMLEVVADRVGRHTPVGAPYDNVARGAASELSYHVGAQGRLSRVPCHGNLDGN